MGRALAAAAVITALMAALSLWGWTVLPPGDTVAMQWGFNGEVSRYGERLEALLLLPVIALLISAFFVLAPIIDPRGKNLVRSGSVRVMVWLGTLGLLAVVHASIVLRAAGVFEMDGLVFPRLTLLLVAALMAVLGNLLGKVRPNWFIGVRTPWTLSSDRSWDVTHRWAGRGLVLTGVVAGGAIVTLPFTVAFSIWITLLLGTTAMAVVISYFAWRSDPDRETYNEEV